MSVKCKGCEGTIEYVPTEVIKGTAHYYNGGPAIAHIPVEYCAWFRDTSAREIIAYINVASYKAGQSGEAKETSITDATLL